MTARKQGSNVDFQQNQTLNPVMHLLSGAPSSPKVGQSYYNTASLVEYVWSGTAWRPKDAAALTDGSIPIAGIAAFKSTVTGYTLDLFASPAAAVNFAGQRLTGIPTGTPSAASDAISYAYLQTYVTASVAGQTAIKNPARVYAAASITLSGTQTIDGVSLNAGDRVLAGAQSTASQNGLYVVASGAWSLATDGNTASEWVEGTEILIAEGTTYGGSIFRQVTQSPTLTTLTFTQTAKVNSYTGDGTTVSLSGTQFSVKFGAGLSTSSGSLAVDTTVVGRKASGTITHDGSTLTFNLTHNLNNATPAVVVRDSSGNRWDVSDQATSANVVQLQWDTAQANGTQFTWSVFG